MAIEWGISKRTINDLCNKGKMPDAIKEGRKWLMKNWYFPLPPYNEQVRIVKKLDEMLALM